MPCPHAAAANSAAANSSGGLGPFSAIALLIEAQAATTHLLLTLVETQQLLLKDQINQRDLEEQTSSEAAARGIH